MSSFLSIWGKTNWSFDVLFILPIFLIIIRSISYYLYARQKDLPPCHSGWIPWVGCAFELGKEPLAYIKKAMDQFGPVFTLKVLGQRMTFVTDEEDIRHFFTSPDLDFELAVHKAVNATALIPPQPLFANHQRLYNITKSRLSAPDSLKLIIKRIGQKFDEHLKTLGKSGHGGLNQLVRRAMYPATVEALFGDNVLPTKHENGYVDFEQYFVRYDGDFELSAQIPGTFNGKFRKARAWLMDKLVKAVSVVENEQTDDPTIFQSLIKSVDREYAPNFSLLLMWGSLANAIPSVFWTMAFVLSDDEILSRLRKEIEEELGPPGKELNELDLTPERLRRLPYVKQCILEAMRLRSPGALVRASEKRHKIKNYTIPEGDLLLMSPYWTHRDPKYFPNPDKFNPDRWPAEDVKKNVFLKGFVPFGGGRAQCPGRFFALLEMHLFVTLLMYKYDFALMDKIPEDSKAHLVGTPQPERDPLVKYSLRQAE